MDIVHLANLEVKHNPGYFVEMGVEECPDFIAICAVGPGDEHLMAATASVLPFDDVRMRKHLSPEMMANMRAKGQRIIVDVLEKSISARSVFKRMSEAGLTVVSVRIAPVNELAIYYIRTPETVRGVRAALAAGNN